MKLFTNRSLGKVRKAVYVGMAGAMMASVLSGCGGIGGLALGRDDSEEEEDESEDESESSDGFDENSSETKKKTKKIESLIDKYFYFDIDDEKREESYYDGLMEGLDDPYSVYYTEEEYQKLLEDDKGTFSGIGATVSKNPDTGATYVVKPLAGSPAEAAGLLPQDIIVQVDDLELTGDMDLDYIVDHIRGEEGTDVTLKIYREGEEDYLDITITRATIVNTSVAYEMLDDNIGYIQVEQFIDNTPELFEDAIDDLQGQGAEGLVIDLRNNPGGLLTSVIEMVDYIVEDDAQADGAEKAGLLLQTKDKDGEVLEELTCSDGHSVDLPIAILINGDSASASEIFSGCMRDYDAATLVGTTTYGKGIVQSVIPLDDGSAVKLTIAKYFLPSGEDIHKKGVDPDVEVELDSELRTLITIPHEDDNQLQEALKTFD